MNTPSVTVYKIRSNNKQSNSLFITSMHFTINEHYYHIYQTGDPNL